jgi:hypothetical protein
MHLSLILHKGRASSKLQEKPSPLKREHPANQNISISLFLLFFWVVFALLGPEPADQNDKLIHADTKISH